MHNRKKQRQRHTDRSVPEGLSVGDIVEVATDSPAHPGAFVAKITDGPGAGIVVFVHDAIDGERVSVQLTEVKRRFARGVVVNVREASPYRIQNIWSAADVSVPPSHRIGGADYGHIELAHQRTLKATVIRDSFARIGHVHAAVIDALQTVEPVEPSDHYRSRVELHVADDGSLGQRVARGHAIMPIHDLPLAVPELEALVGQLSFPPTDVGKRVLLNKPSDDDALVIVDGIVRGGAHNSELAGNVTISMREGDVKFAVASNGFWQAHIGAATALAASVSAAVTHAAQAGLVDVGPSTPCIDLYGGVGLFARALGALGFTVTSVEGDAIASAFARQNLMSPHTAVHADVREYVRTWEANTLARGIVVLDPPRVGAGLDVATAIAKAAPAVVVYVACDPVAMARDVGLFTTSGYTLTSLRAFDCFPHTHHVEAIAVLTRDRAA